MSGCECKRGFFALRDCPEPVVSRCPGCRRAICRQHRAEGHALGLCLDCQAREAQPQTRQQPAPRRGGASRPVQNEHTVTVETDSSSGYDDRAVAERRSRLAAAGYAPVAVSHSSHGSGNDSSHGFDAQDLQAFEQQPLERDDDFADGSGSLADS